MNIYFEHGEIFKLFRHRANLSKKEVAEYLGKTPATITNYESGYTYPSVSNLRKLKELYGEEFAHALKMMYDYGKNPFLSFRRALSDSISSDDSNITFEKKHYPNLARIKAYLNEINEQKESD